MKTLLTLFGKERSELETEMNQATGTKQAVKLVQNRLDSLERNYIGELNVKQVRLVKFFLDTLRQSLATLKGQPEEAPAAALSKLNTTNETAVLEPAQQSTNQVKQSSTNRFILKLLQGLLCIGILSSLFSLTKDTPAAWMAILLVSVLIGLEVLQFDKDNQEAQHLSAQPAEAPQLPAPIDSKVLLDNLAVALDTIDRAVTQTETNLPGASGMEEMPEVLDFLQKLWGASLLENPIMMLELTKLIPQILLEQGIRAQSYQPNEAPDRGYFDFEPSIDRSAKDYVTLTPALLKGDRLLRRGRVIEPLYSK